MRVRLSTIGPARALYLVTVAVALAVVSYRTFATDGPSPGTTGDTTAVIDTTATSGPDSTTTLPAAATTSITQSPATTTVKKPGSAPSGLTSAATTTTAPHASPDQQMTPSPVTASTVAPTTTVRPSPTTTVVLTTTTTIYRPGSIVMTIPAGTKAKINRGEDVSDVLPLAVDLKVNQYIYLVNKDDYFYSYGPLDVMPQSTTVWFFNTPGTTVGYCDIARTTVTFRVTA